MALMLTNSAFTQEEKEDSDGSTNYKDNEYYLQTVSRGRSANEIALEAFHDERESVED